MKDSQDWLEPTIDETLRNRVKFIGDNEWSMVGYPDEVIQELKQAIKAHIKQEASKGELEAIKATLANVKSVEYPPSGKEYHFVDGGWSNNLTEAADRVAELRSKFNNEYKEV